MHVSGDQRVQWRPEELITADSSRVHVVRERVDFSVIACHVLFGEEKKDIDDKDLESRANRHMHG